MPETSRTEPKAHLPASVHQRLRCPVCTRGLEQIAVGLRCVGSECGLTFPVIEGIPVLIDEGSSVFTLDEFRGMDETFFAESSKGRLTRTLKRLMPTMGVNVKGAANYARFAQLLSARSESPKVLVIGGSILGEGMQALANQPSIELIETDVSFGPRTQLILDAHDIPFEDETFDGVVVQAVLEHVADPYRCVDEIRRVLKTGGAAYAETAFLQPVHGGRYDFTRFTLLGHRRLFRWFEEVDSGAVCGTGMVLANAYRSFLYSFAGGRTGRRVARAFAQLTAFGWKYFDKLLIDRPATSDGAAGVYFLGHKSDKPISDREIIEQYRGAN
jgi:SAM-dependent methyltransferase